jgi:23S rRNA pseudouridine1911/1915/1917 synthase
MDQATPGIKRCWTVPAACQDVRVDTFVRECLPHLSRRQVDEAVRGGLFSRGGNLSRKGDRLSAGDTLVFNGPAAWLAAQPLPDTTLDVPVVYEDAAILIVDKPAGMATHGFSGRDAGTVANFIAAKYSALLAVGKSRWEPGIVHRLDRETSGLVLVAKTQAAFDELRRQFRRRRIMKVYWALVWGITSEEGVIDLPLAHDSRDRRRMCLMETSSRKKTNKTWKAVTRYRKLGESQGSTLVEIKMATGVTHQIRVHMAAIGHPIVADALYGAEHSQAFGLKRHFLHAMELEFRHPDNDREFKVKARLPDDLRKVLRRLRIKI